MDYTTKLAYQSNYWYNDGLKRANIRDLTGAITSLKKSLQYNRDNIASRNLLGLVYYGRGDVVEALTEWESPAEREHCQLLYYKDKREKRRVGSDQSGDQKIQSGTGLLLSAL